MHLCCLGLMKKLLEYWLTSIVDKKMDNINIMMLTQRLINLQSQIPVEFQRQILQSLTMVKKWKATEFRFFLLYVGPIIMKNLMPQD